MGNQPQRESSTGGQSPAMCVCVSVHPAGPQLQPLLLWALQHLQLLLAVLLAPDLGFFLGCISWILILAKLFPLLSNTEERKLMRAGSGAIFNPTAFPRHWKSTNPRPLRQGDAAGDVTAAQSDTATLVLTWSEGRV